MSAADCRLLSLPPELLFEIRAHLDPLSVLRVGATCRLLAAVAQADLIWKPLVLAEFWHVEGNFSDPTWAICEGWEDMVELFAGLAIGHEDCDDPWFTAWHTAYRSAVLQSQDILAGSGAGFKIRLWLHLR